MSRLQIISLGAGVQSSTMALLAAQGKIEPMPDAAVFADTQDEPASVYRWLDWLEKRLPFPVHRVTVGRLSEEELKLRVSKKTGVTYRRGLIPAYWAGGSMNFRHCTQEFKLRPIWKKYQQLAGITAWCRKPSVVQWIGISMDEATRMKPSRKRWLESRWPLIYDVPMTRDLCLQWMAEQGYPRPPRSACVFCPYHTDAEWIRLKTQEPEAFERAVLFERQLTALSQSVGQGAMSLHAKRVPLDQVVFKPGKKDADAFQEECEGMCGV